MATAAIIDAPTDIALVVTQNPGIVLLDTEKFDAFYAKMKAETDKLVADVTTNKGRDEIRSMAARIRTSKASIDKARLGLTAEWRENTKRANDAGKVIEERLETLAVEVRKPLTDWEAREKHRIGTIDSMLAELKAHARVDSLDTAEMVRTRGTQVWALTFDPEVYQDRLAEIEQAKQDAVDALKTALARLTKEEEDRAELAKLRAEAAAREDRDRAEREAREAEERAAAEAKAAEEARVAAEKAEQERLARIEQEAAERAKREAEEAAEAERDRVQREHEEQLAAERAKAAEAERLRQAEADRVAEVERQREAREAADRAEAKRLADEQADRERNKAHRTKIKTTAKEAIMTCGCSEETAQKIVLAIIAGEVPAVTLEF